VTVPADTTTSASTVIDVRTISWIRPLVGAYAFDFDSIAHLYSGNPASRDAWADALRRTHAFRRDPEKIAAVVAAQQERRGAPPEARAAAARLADRSAVAITTGQQAGVFGGPLFTLLKAISALQLAKRSAEELGVTAIPIFWVDAEDHDWAEIRSATVLDADFQPKTITLANLDGAGELPIASLTLDDRIEQSIQELLGALAPTDFTSWVSDLTRRAYRPRAGVADAFARWIEAVLGPHGLVVFDSTDPDAKRLASPVFVRELTAPGRTASLAADAADAFTACGHTPQVVPPRDGVSLFYLDGKRQPIRREGDHYVIGDRAVALDALAREADTDPSRFSPNVLLRPIVQDTLFPTICYVAGPSELAYLGQLRGVYEHFAVPMPLMSPRATATIIDGAASRFLAKHPIPFEQLQARDESALNRLLESQLPVEIDHSLKEADAALHAAFQRVIDAMPSLDPTLAGAAKTTLGRMEHDLRTLQNKVIQAAKRRDETLRRQFTRTQAQIFPLGQPQERTLTMVFFLNRYGPGLVDALMRSLPMDIGRHCVLTL
jgi:bacillithiol biosynthesis cysteine-adding enzyme BshC